MAQLKAWVWAPDNLWTEISGIENGEWKRLDSLSDLSAVETADALFILSEANSIPADLRGIPCFVHSVATPLSQMGAPENVIRLNAWPGFLNRSVWEVCGNISTFHLDVMRKLGKEFVQVADEPGFVSARVISMIINEAYFALEEGVSSKADMNTALKLGTNYPYGPFEWAELIGLKEIFNLLLIISREDPRYRPAPLLETEAHAL